MDKYVYLIKALRAYRVVSYGQFDRETHHVVRETQDAANAIEELEYKLATMIAAKNKALEALKGLASVTRTFSNEVPKNEQAWTSLDDALAYAFSVISELEVGK